MKNKIAEVQNYFLNKITACEFELIDIDFLSSKWVRLNVKIDGFDFSFAIEPVSKLYCAFNSDFKIEIPADRLENLLKFTKDKSNQARIEKIEKLKLQLIQLENN